MGYSWNQHHRCPNCHGYAGAFKKSQRCRGFKHRDGEGYFCEQEPEDGGLSRNFSGYDLYYYSYEEEE